MKIIGMIPVRDEHDIIEEIIQYYISEGIELVILDNGSKDGTFEICKKYEKEGVLDLIYFPTENWIMKMDEIFRVLYDKVIEKKPDWVVLIGSDEFFESGEESKTLKDIVTQADKEGFNLIQLDRFDFFMTEDDNKGEKSIRRKMLHYSYHGDYLYRAWKYYPGIKAESFASVHFPQFPEGLQYKIYPKKLVMRHYPYRTTEQTRQRLDGRLRGVEKTSYTSHYKNLSRQSPMDKINTNLLSKYFDNSEWNKELLYTPFVHDKPMKKEKIFDADGRLLMKPKSAWELEMELYKLKEYSIELKIIRLLVYLRDKIRK